MAFDLQSIRKGLSALPQFDSIDDDGDVKLYIPASGNLGHELLVWIYVGDSSVVADASTRRLKLKGNLKEVAADAAYEFEGFDIKLNSNGDDIRVKRRFDEDNTRQPFETAVVDKVRKFIAAQPEIWAYILDKLGQNAKPAKDFNADDVRQGMRQLPGFQSVDDDGDVKFYIEPTGDLSHEILVWSYVRADHVTVDASTRKLKLKGDLKGAIEAAGRRFSDWTIKLNSDGDDIRVQRRWEASDLNGDNSTVLSSVKESLAAMPEIWAFILDKLGQNAKPAKDFNADEVRQGMRQLPGFQEIDGDGDVKFYIEPTGDLSHELLVWSYVRADHVTVDASTRKLKLKGDLKGAIEAAERRFSDWTIKLNSDGDDIRVQRRWEASDLNGDNSAVLSRVKESLAAMPEIWAFILDKLGQNTKPDKKFNPDDVRRRFKSKPGFQKVDDDGDIQFFLPPNNYCKHELLMWIYVRPDEVKIETRTCHLRLDGDLNGAIRAVSQAPHGFTLKLNRDGDDILAIKSFKASQMRSDDIDAEVVREISKTVDELLPMMWGAILEFLGQNSIPKPVAEHDDDDDVEEDEEEEITGSSFTYTLRGSGTVRELQEAFTEDYPYLRIGVFMVKTAQGADRSGGTISSYDSDTEFSDIRAFKGECKIRFTPESTPKSLEADFRKVSGLAIKICYNDEDDHRYYIGKDSDEYTMGIAKINHLFRQRGYEKADIS